MATTTNNGWTTPDDTSFVKDGALSIRTLGSAIDTSTGKGLIAWQTYAPVISSTGAAPVWANGNGVYNYAKFCQIGKTVHFAIRFTFGTLTTKSTTNVMSISLPITAAVGNVMTFAASASVAGNAFIMSVLSATTTTVQLFAINSAGTYANPNGVTASIPAAWVTGDSIIFNGTYEAA